MAGAVRAVVLSLALHVAAATALCLAGRAGAPASAGESMCIETVSADAPRLLPAVAALALADVAVDYKPLIPTGIAPARQGQPDQRETSDATHAALLTPTTTFFEVPAVGTSVVYVIDRSASMGLAGRLDRAVREVAASLRRLPTAARFQVIAYGRSAEPIQIGRSGLLPAEGPVIETAAASLMRLSAEGGTDHARALRAALVLNPDVVFLLTDEDDFRFADAAAVTAYNRGRSVIHTVCLVAPLVAATPLAELARCNGGRFRVAAE